MEALWDRVSKKLGLTDEDEINCVKNILLNSLLLNDLKEKAMSEEKLDMLTKITGGYVREVLSVIDDPHQYRRKLNEFKTKVMECSHGS